MADLPVFWVFTLYGAPYWLLAVVAVLGALRRPRTTPAARRFVNRFAGLGIAAVLLGVVVVALAFLFYALLGCEGGMIDPVACARGPDALGAALESFAFTGLLVTEVVGLPSLVVCILAEVASRRRRAAA